MPRAVAQSSLPVKRYGGSRLYDPAAAGYVTAADLRDLAAAGIAVVVRVAVTGAEVTADMLGAPERPN